MYRIQGVASSEVAGEDPAEDETYTLVKLLLSDESD